MNKTAFIIIFLAKPVYATIPDDFTTYLSKNKLMSSSEATCKEMESKIGQLFYMKVDNYQTDHFINPIYSELIKKIKPGGILLRRNGGQNTTFEKNWDEIEKIKKLAFPNTPFISDDFSPNQGQFLSVSHDLYDTEFKCKLSAQAALIAAANFTGTWNPAIETQILDDQDVYKKKGYYVPDLKRNESLLPQITSELTSATNKFAIIPTIKHFPFTIDVLNGKLVNLHKESPNVVLTPQYIDDHIIQTFKNALVDGFIMTTHARSSSVDVDEITTTSKKWIDLLRNKIGAKDQLVITDALDMVDNYDDFNQISLAPKEAVDDFKKLKISNQSVVAYKAIMAGHDMITYQDSSERTEMYYRDLMKIACQSSVISKKFQDRVRESYVRIISFKKRKEAQMNRPKPQITDDDIRRLQNATESSCDKENVNYSIEPILNKIITKQDSLLPCSTQSAVLDQEAANKIDKLQSVVDGLQKRP